MEKNNHFKNRKIDIDSFLINENILYLLNKARTSPQSFSKYLNVNNKSDIEIINLYNFFNNYSLKVEPLISNINLSWNILKIISSIFFNALNKLTIIVDKNNIKMIIKI